MGIGTNSHMTSNNGNLFFYSQLSTNNNIVVSNGKMVMVMRCEGRSNLYPLITSFTPKFSSNFSVISSLWRDRLGRQGASILNYIGKHNFISYNKLKDSKFCNSIFKLYMYAILIFFIVMHGHLLF